MRQSTIDNILVVLAWLTIPILLTGIYLTALRFEKVPDQGITKYMMKGKQ